MELQQSSYSCGPASLRAAFYVLGKRVSERALRKVAGTTPEDGTDENGIMKAAEHYNFRHKEIETTSVREASDLLKKSLRKGRPVLLCVDRESHWTAAVGMLGNKIIIFDPSNHPKKRKRYSGLRIYSLTDLTNRWGCLENEIMNYYGIPIYPGKE